MHRAKNKGSANQVRIIAGSHRSRLVSFPDHEGLRPTGDRVRETLFNWLQMTVPHSHCLDLFAGSGVLGIEALSRGAKQLQFVESARKVADTLASNLQQLELAGGDVCCDTAECWLQNSSNWSEPFDIVFVDPPYVDNKLDTICDQLENSGCLSDAAKIYIENDTALQPENLPANWIEMKAKKAGNIHFYLFQRKGAAV